MNKPSPIEVGKSITKGTHPDRKVLQDRMSVPEPSPFKVGMNQRIHIFDGHGENGERAAEIASSVFFNERQDTPAYRLPALFAEAHKEIADRSVDGGTTATAIDISYDEQGTQIIHSAWVGDSPAFLVHPSIEKLRAERILSLTNPLHNVDNMDEVERTRKLNIEVSGHRFGTYYLDPLDPENPQFVALAVSRALGDVAISQYTGTIPTPDFMKLETPVERQYGNLLIAGSDGVFYNDNQLNIIANILMHYDYSKNLQTTAEYITNSMAKISGDDATLAIVQLRNTQGK